MPASAHREHPAPARPGAVPDPSSVAWRRGSDARVALAAGYALLLQVSHPTVGAGVSEHSSFRRDPWGRLLRTLDYTCAMVYGGERAAADMGLRIRAMHARIRGTLPDGRPYQALEPEAYAWVHATLAAGIVAAHERFGRALDRGECEELWAQWRALGGLLGISDRELPGDWPGFEAYFEAMAAGRLEHTAAVDEVLEALARPLPPQLPAAYRPLWPAWRTVSGHLIGLSTAGLLGPALRRRLGVPWSARREGELRLLARTLRAAAPLTPGPLRVTGPGYLRWRHQAGA